MNPHESTFGDSRGRHSAVVASALDAIITINSNGTILEFNPSASQTFGWSEREAVGQLLSDLIIPARYREAHQAGMAHYLKTGQGPVLGKRIEIEALHRSGREMPVELAITPIQTEQGTVFTAFLRDLSESKALIQRLNMVDFTIEQSSDSIYWINERAEIINCNLAAANSLGYPREDVIGMRVFDIDTTMRPEMWETHWEDLQKATTIQIESVHRRADGTMFPVEVYANYIVHDGVEYNCAFARDITLRQDSQRRIFETSQRLELVLEAAEIGFWDWNLKTGEKIVNERYLALCSTTREEYSPSPEWFQSLIHPDDVEAAYGRLQRHLAGEIERIDSQFRLRTIDGGWRWVHDRGRVVEREANGTPIRAMGTMQDVTLRRGAIEALKESEQRFRDIVSSMGEFVWEADRAFRLRFISDPIADITGRSPTDLIGARVDELTTEDHHSIVADHLRSCLEGEESVVTVDAPAQTKSGDVRWIQISAQPILSANGEHVGFRGTGLDITQQRTASELRRRSAELQEISRSIVMGLLEPGNLVPQIESLLSRLAGFLGADRAYLLRAETGINSVASSSHWFSERLRSSATSYPMRTSNIDPAELTELQPGTPILTRHDQRSRPSWLQLDTATHLGIPVLVGDIPLNYLGFDWLSPRLPAEQDVSILLGLGASLGHSIERRITKRQLEESAQQLTIEAQRSEEASKAKSAFLAHMSHELRTPLTAVLGCSEILANGKPDESQVQQLLASIQSNGRSLLAQINSVLELSRYEQGGTPVRPEPVRVLDLLDEVRSSIAPTAIIEDVAVTFDITTELPAQIISDRFQLSQVLVNLITNSVRYSHSPDVNVRLSISPGTDSELRIDVVDHGVGLPDEFLDKVFEPFERAPGVAAPGTGLGLAICKRIIEALGGMLSCASHPGVETCFTCLVPLKPYGTDRIKPGPVVEQPKPRRSNEFDKKSLAGVRVLLAEDSVHVRDVIEYFLSDMGASVEHVGTGLDAVDTVRHRSTEFDVVLMDMQMPDMDGYEAASELKSIGFSIPIIALTAHGLAEDRKRCLDAGCDDYLSKPVSPGHLAVAIKRLLHDRGFDGDAQSHTAAQAERTPESVPSELIARYVQHLRSQTRDFGMAQTDRPELRRQMHQIKGTAATMGLRAISNAAADVEQAINREKSNERVVELLERLMALIDA